MKAYTGVKAQYHNLSLSNRENKLIPIPYRHYRQQATKMNVCKWIGGGFIEKYVCFKSKESKRRVSVLSSLAGVDCS